MLTFFNSLTPQPLARVWENLVAPRSPRLMQSLSHGFRLAHRTRSAGRRFLPRPVGVLLVCSTQMWRLGSFIILTDVQARSLVEVDNSISATHSLYPDVLNARTITVLINCRDEHPRRE